jgi:hypothetical protein
LVADFVFLTADLTFSDEMVVFEVFPFNEPVEVVATKEIRTKRITNKVAAFIINYKILFCLNIFSIRISKGYLSVSTS